MKLGLILLCHFLRHLTESRCLSDQSLHCGSTKSRRSVAVLKNCMYGAACTLVSQHLNRCLSHCSRSDKTPKACAGPLLDSGKPYVKKVMKFMPRATRSALISGHSIDRLLLHQTSLVTSTIWLDLLANARPIWPELMQQSPERFLQ